MRRVFLMFFVCAALVALSVTTVAAGDRAEMAGALNKLEGKTIASLEYENADLADVVKDISRAADISIIVSKAVKAEAYTVSLELTNIKASSALNIVIEEHGLKLQFAYGVFFVRTADEALKKAVVTTKIYDIRDKLMRIRDFKAPEITLAKDDESRITAPDDDEKEPPSEEELMELVQKNVEPDLWGTGKHRMSIFRKQLVVATSAEVHAKIAAFLAQLSAA